MKISNPSVRASTLSSVLLGVVVGALVTFAYIHFFPRTSDWKKAHIVFDATKLSGDEDFLKKVLKNHHVADGDHKLWFRKVQNGAQDELGGGQPSCDHGDDKTGGIHVTQQVTFGSGEELKNFADELFP